VRPRRRPAPASVDVNRFDGRQCRTAVEWKAAFDQWLAAREDWLTEAGLLDHQSPAVVVGHCPFDEALI